MSQHTTTLIEAELLLHIDRKEMGRKGNTFEYYYTNVSGTCKGHCLKKICLKVRMPFTI